MSNLAIKQPRPQRIIMWIASTTDEKFYVSLTVRNALIDAETNRKDKSIIILHWPGSEFGSKPNLLKCNLWIGGAEKGGQQSNHILTS